MYEEARADALLQATLGRERSPVLNEARAQVAHMLRVRGYSLPRICALMDGRDKSTISVISARGSTSEPIPGLEEALERWLILSLDPVWLPVAIRQDSPVFDRPFYP